MLAAKRTNINFLRSSSHKSFLHHLPPTPPTPPILLESNMFQSFGLKSAAAEVVEVVRGGGGAKERAGKGGFWTRDIDKERIEGGR